MQQFSTWNTEGSEDAWIMKIVRVTEGSKPIDTNFDVLLSEFPLSYLYGIRDAKGVDAVLIGSNGAEDQIMKSMAPYHTEYKSIGEALKGLGYEL